METTCGFKSHLPHRAKKSQTKWSGSFFDRSGSGLEPRFKVSAPLRSAQSRGPPDLVRPIFRRLCLPARSVRSMWSTGPHSPHLPLAGADLNPGSRSPLRSGLIYINENCTKWSSRKAWYFGGFANRVFRSVLLELNVYKVPEVLGRILWFNS